MTELGPDTGDARRVYVLDTNVLLYDPRALFVFHEHDVVIPITVIEEVDRFKKDLNETGRNARQISRYLDELRGQGSLSRGVPLPGGGTLLVDHAFDDTKISWGGVSNDNRILQTCVRLARAGVAEVVLITRDTNMRLKCDALGVAAEDYEHAHIDIDEQYSGVAERTVPSAWIDAFYAESQGRLDPELFSGLHAQQFLLLTAEDNPSKTALGRVDVRKERVRMVGRHKEGVWGIFARNKEQLFALDLLLDDSISLVTLNGVAGTGKTLIAIAAGLKKVADERAFTKMLVSRPIFPMGRDMGFLPGDIEQKLNPWMKPIYDSLEFLLSTHLDSGRGRHSSQEPQYQQLLDQRIIEVEPLTYIRGRSIPRQLLIVDEAQNLTPHEAKTVLTRAGEGTKVIMTGDPNQIDNPYVDALSNGLTYVVERFKDAPIAGHVTLRKGERSELAELAAELL
ncbi:MAG: PhoH family protein [Deltaproteobacteria bacterium]|nr:MAG: PhoH family protein [Deltaproteobacteria bacterium]